ncbi:PREDICTED: uncharacterized protein LOC109244284 [Nicotiana attenuata]|uniref:uncharacterized protein LOC109244284 n=1 Tax=Nicotiana attenuata TaxID=49451 RepID=UPI0009046E43|nr:PREDICTED: uncharacterized protein LOC109244284 [Nicotiana attenuata]
MGQISQSLSTRPKEALPSDTVVNPKGENNTVHARAVTTRSGKGGDATTSSQTKIVDDEKVVQEDEMPNYEVKKNDEMSYGLCNAPVTFQRCMMAIFTDMVKDILEVFMDDFSVVWDSFDDCLANMDKVLLMCNASDVAVGAILGQRINKIFHTVYYASKTMNSAQVNYSVTEKELLAIVFAMEMFRPYLMGAKVIVHTDHWSLCYLINKKDSKARNVLKKKLAKYGKCADNTILSAIAKKESAAA